MAAKKLPTDTEHVARLLKRRARANARREAFRRLYQEIEDYSAPDRANWNKGAEGQKRNKTFDSTAINARTSFANRIQSDMMPPFQRWVVLKAGEYLPKSEREKLQKVLDDATQKVHAVLQSSNFDTANNEFLHDLAAGTAIMLPEEGGPDEPLNFYAIPPSHCAIEEGARGMVGAVFRDYTSMRLQAIQETWRDAKLTEEMKNAASEEKKQENEYNLIECCWKMPGSKQWGYQVIEEKTKAVLVSRTYDRQVMLVARWSKMAGEVWGRGPLVLAMPDIKTINKLVEMILRHAALRIAGVWAVSNDGVVNGNNIQITPGATIPVARTAGPNGPSIANISPQGDIQVAELEREKLQSNIKRVLLDHTLPPDTGPVRSATEIMERVKELVKDVGAPFGRIIAEYIRPLVQIILDLLYKRGELKEPINIDGLLVKVQVVSPLAQVQNLTDVENIVRWMQILASFGTETLYIAAKMEDIGDYIGELLGVPSAVRRTQDERQKLQQSVAQLIAAKQQAPALPAGQGGGQGETVQVA